LKLALFVTEDWYLVSHRLQLVEAAIADGHEVLVLAHVVDHRAQIEATGAQLCDVPLLRASANPIDELKLLLAVTRALRRFRPDVLHSIALKPVLYGTASSYLARVRGRVNAMVGMGELFVAEGGLGRRVLRRALAAALRRPGEIIVQNPDDGATIARLGVPEERISLIRGAGVDVEALTPVEEPPSPPIRVGYVGRLIELKGLNELHEAAVALATSHPDISIELVGDRDPSSPSCVPEATIESWRTEGIVRLHGQRNDVPDFWASCHVAVQPSYSEGVPKSLLEAAAIGVPMVATDVPGCREVVVEGVTGLLVPPRDPEALAAALARLATEPSLRASMRTAARALAVEEFDVRNVNLRTLEVYRRVGG
jgi:glycosyltransferase involved in cell wall biosynthesis